MLLRKIALVALSSTYSWQLHGKEEQPIFYSIPLTIDQACRAALFGRSSQKSREYETRKRKADSLAVLSGYLPQISLSTAYITGSRSDTILRERVSVFAKNRTYLRAQQRLIDFAGPVQRYRIAQQDTSIAMLNELLDGDKIHWEVERDFITLWKLHHKKPFIAALGKSASSMLNTEENRGCLGLLDYPSVTKAQALFARDHTLVARYTDDMQESWSNLQASIDQEINAPLSDEETSLFVERSIWFGLEHDLPFYLRQAQCYRKELQVKEEEIRREQMREELYLKSYLPTVSAYVQLDRGGLISWFSPVGISAGGDVRRRKAPLWQCGVEFNWEFDGLANAHRAVGAQESVAKAIMERNDTLRIIRREVESGHAHLERKVKDLAAAEQAMIAAEQTYKKEQSRLDLGLLSKPAFDAAQQAVEQARYALIEAKSEAALASQELLYKCGYPNVTDNACTMS